MAHAVTVKFADHVPLHRLAGQWARSGVCIACSNLSGWMAQVAVLLSPLVALMHARLLESRVIHGDDTGVKLSLEGAGKAAKPYLRACIGDRGREVGGDAVLDHGDLQAPGHRPIRLPA